MLHSQERGQPIHPMGTGQGMEMGPGKTKGFGVPARLLKLAAYMELPNKT